MKLNDPLEGTLAKHIASQAKVHYCIIVFEINLSRDEQNKKNERLHLPMQGTQVQILIQEDPTYQRAMKTRGTTIETVLGWETATIAVGSTHIEIHGPYSPCSATSSLCNE